MKELHPLWPYLPPEQRTRRHKLQVQLRRQLARLQGRRERVAVVTGVYVLIWSTPLLLGQPLLTFFALLPLCLVPPVGLLIYRLVWKEFHD